MSAHVLVLLAARPDPQDIRLKMQVPTLLEHGYQVTVIAPTGYGHDKLEETVNGVKVRRFTPAPATGGSLSYLREYAVAVLRIARLARRTHRQQPVDLVLVCSPPDLLVLSALPLVRRGARLLFDAREPSPELFEAKFRRQGLLHRLLILCERFAVRRSDVVIAVSEPFIDLLHTRCRVRRDRIFLVLNGPDPERIYAVEPHPALRRGRKHLVLFLGEMSDQEGLERLIEAADGIANGTGRRDVTFALVGPGDARDRLRAEVQRRHLEDTVFISDPVGDDMVRAYLSTADVCVGVDERVGMNDITVMIKILEYMAVGRPIVQFPLKEMRRICGDAAVYARNADSRDLGEKISALLDDPERRRRLGADAGARAHDGLMWPHQIPAFLEAVSTALTPGGEGAGGSRAHRG